VSVPSPVDVLNRIKVGKLFLALFSLGHLVAFDLTAVELDHPGLLR